MTRPIALRPASPRRDSSRMSQHVRLLACLLLGLANASTQGDDSPLALTDLADYRRALVARGSERAPALIRFRELWDHATKYEGTRVQVEGRIVRRFRQGAYGTFPPLVEAWAVTPSGDPFCWVYPAPRDDTTAPSGQENVRFVGTYLKRIRYQGADVERLAPLIVGPRPPSFPRRVARPAVVRSRNAVNDWVLGLACAAVVVAVIAWQALRRPVSRPSSLEWGPAPQFEPPPSDTHTQDVSSDH